MKTLEMMKQGKGRMMRIRSWWRAVGSGGDKQGSKVVSPAATAVTFDRAATGWTLPTYSPKLPTLATHTNMSMTEVFQRIGPVWTSPFLPLYKSIGGILSRMLDLMWNLMSNLK